VSSRKLDADAFKHLDAIRMLGFGQSYTVMNEEEFEEASLPQWVGRDGKPLEVLTDQQKALLDATNANPNKHAYVYHRYTVRRVCDSGD
jgi:hypothetical protein